MVHCTDSVDNTNRSILIAVSISNMIRACDWRHPEHLCITIQFLPTVSGLLISQTTCSVQMID
jgi:hypothetical protein